MLSRDEIDRKCDEKNLNGVCCLMKGHDGACTSSLGYRLRVMKHTIATCANGGCNTCDGNHYDRSP